MVIVIVTLLGWGLLLWIGALFSIPVSGVVEIEREEWRHNG